MGINMVTGIVIGAMIFALYKIVSWKKEKDAKAEELRLSLIPENPNLAMIMKLMECDTENWTQCKHKHDDEAWQYKDGLIITSTSTHTDYAVIVLDSGEKMSLDLSRKDWGLLYKSVEKLEESIKIMAAEAARKKEQEKIEQAKVKKAVHKDLLVALNKESVKIKMNGSF